MLVFERVVLAIKRKRILQSFKFYSSPARNKIRCVKKRKVTLSCFFLTKNRKSYSHVRLFRVYKIRTRQLGPTRTKHTESNKEQRERCEGIRDPWATWVICTRESIQMVFSSIQTVFSFKHETSRLRISVVHFPVWSARASWIPWPFICFRQRKNWKEVEERGDKRPNRNVNEQTVPFQYQTHGSQFCIKERERKKRALKRRTSTMQSFCKQEDCTILVWILEMK